MANPACLRHRGKLEELRHEGEAEEGSKQRLFPFPRVSRECPSQHIPVTETRPASL